jgi:hypothetical protein
MASQKLISFLYFPLFMISLLLAVAAPRTLAFSVPLLGMISLVLVSVSTTGREELIGYLIAYRKFALLLIAIVIIAALSLMWSISVEVSSERLLRSLPILGLGFFVPLAWRRMDKDWLPYVLVGSLSVLLIGLFFVGEELLFDMPVYRYVKGYTPTEWFHPSFLNRQTVFMCLIFFLIYPAIFYIDQVVMKWFFMILLPVILAAVLWMTESQGCQLAILVGAMMYFLFPHRSRAAWWILKSILVVCVLFAPWIAFIGFDLFAEHMRDYEWMQNGYAAERLEIWDFISLRILENPLYGFGMEATRVIDDFETEKLYHPAATILHPHNFALQLWIEYGVIGALLGSIFLWVLFDSIQKVPTEWLQKSMLSFVMAALVISAIGYGLWQGWWLGLFFMGAGFISLIRQLAYNEKEIVETRTLE